MEERNYLERCFARNPFWVMREIAGEVILIPTRQTEGEVASIFALNEVSAYIWGLIDGKRSAHEIRDAVVDEFEVDPAEAGADLVEFLRKLEGIGAIEEI